jgi:molybdenum cofactor biosynthesis enzyme MoaA
MTNRFIKHFPASKNCIKRQKLLADYRAETADNYRNGDCPNCKRHRIQADGVCEKCFWDVTGNDYASITRPNEYNAQGYIYHDPSENTEWFK